MEDTKIDVSGNMSVPPTQNIGGPLEFSSLRQLEKIPTLKEMAIIIRKSVRPWSEFLNTTNFKAAASMARLTSRFMRNLGYFQSNYLIIFIILMIYCLITSPLLLLVLTGVALASYKIHKSQAPVTICNHEFGVNYQIMAVHVASIPILFLVGAGTALFWTLGASCCVISLHAAFYNIDAIVTEETEGFMTEVV